MHTFTKTKIFELAIILFYKKNLLPYTCHGDILRRSTLQHVCVARYYEAHA